MPYNALTPLAPLLADPAACTAGLFALVLLLVLLRQGRQLAHLKRLTLRLGERLLDAQRDESDRLAAHLATTERALGAAIAAGNADAMGRALEGIDRATGRVGVATERLRVEIEARLRELRLSNESRLADIQRSVNEQLAAAVEQQMTASFARVADQFAALQRAMGDVAAVTAQIADVKRLFSNVGTRGGWGETQVRLVLDDILPPGSYDTNWRPRADSLDAVEFALIMPARGGIAPRLPIDAKFPVADYERLIAAVGGGDAAGERAARRALERVMREQARQIQSKYICPPATVEFAVMYLPTDGLYAEVARMPGLIDDLGRTNQILVMGPTLLPALLRSIQLGHVTLAIERRADEIRLLLGATRTEMARMDEVLERLSRQAGQFVSTLDRARTRTRAVDRRLRDVAAMDGQLAEELLDLAPQATAARVQNSVADVTADGVADIGMPARNDLTKMTSPAGRTGVDAAWRHDL
jgi:DNA recombination protein RmuC